MRRAPPRCRPGLLHPGGSAGHTERQAPYLSGSIGPARDRAHDENPPLPACEQRPRDAVQRGSAQGGPPASELTAPRAHSSRKALHVRPGEGGRRASCPARCRRAALNFSPGDGTSANSLGADMPRCRSHRERSSNVGRSGRLTQPDRSRLAGIADQFARNTHSALPDGEKARAAAGEAIGGSRTAECNRIEQPRTRPCVEHGLAVTTLTVPRHSAGNRGSTPRAVSTL